MPVASQEMAALKVFFFAELRPEVFHISVTLYKPTHELILHNTTILILNFRFILTLKVSVTLRQYAPKQKTDCTGCFDLRLAPADASSISSSLSSGRS